MPKPGILTGNDVFLGDVALNAIDDNSVAWIITDLDGWWGLPDVEVPDDPRPFAQDGSYYTTGRYTARTISMKGYILPLDGVSSKAVTSRNAFNRALNLVRARTQLKVREQGLDKVALVQISSRPLVRISQASGLLEFDIALKATDPLKYADASKYYNVGLEVSTPGRTYDRVFDFSYGGAPTTNVIEVVNDGSYASYPEFTITGPVLNPTIEHVNTGQELEFKTQITIGEPMTVRPLTKQVLVQGENRRNTLTPSSKWFPMYPGTNLIRFTGTQTIPPQEPMNPQRNLAPNPIPADAGSSATFGAEIRRNRALITRPTAFTNFTGAGGTGTNSVQSNGGMSQNSSWLSRMLTAAGGTYMTISGDNASSRIPVTAGTTYLFGASLLYTSPATRATVYVTWRDSGGVQVGQDIYPNTPGPLNQWHRVYGSSTAPAGATTAALGVTVGQVTDWAVGESIGVTEFSAEVVSTLASRTNAAPNPKAVGAASGAAIPQFATYGLGTNEDGVSMSASNPTNAVVYTNLVTNPSFEVDTTGWAPGGGTIATYNSSSSSWWPDFTQVPRGIRDVVATADGANSYLTIAQDSSSQFTLTPGKWVGVHALVASDGLGTNASRGVRVDVALYGGATTQYAASGNFEQSTFYTGRRIMYAFQVPADVTGGRVRIQAFSGNTGTVIATGQRLWADCIMAVQAETQAEALAAVSTYFDGSTATADATGGVRYVHAFTGTAHASTSTRSITITPSDTGPSGVNGFARRVITKAKTSNSSGWNASSGSSYRGVISGNSNDPVTVSAWVRFTALTDPGTVHRTVRLRTTAYTTPTSSTVAGTTGSEPAVLLPMNEWVRVSTTLTSDLITANYGSVGWWVYQTTGSNLPVGSTIDVAGVLIEKSQTAGTYFDGATPNSEGIFYVWGGVANTTPSYVVTPPNFFDGATDIGQRNQKARWTGTANASASIISFTQRGWDVSDYNLFKSENTTSSVRRPGSTAVRYTRLAGSPVDRRVVTINNLGQYASGWSTAAGIYPDYQNATSVYVNPSMDGLEAVFTLTYYSIGGALLSTVVSDPMALSASSWQRLIFIDPNTAPTNSNYMTVSLEIRYTGTDDAHIGAMVSVQDMKTGIWAFIDEEYFDGNYPFARWESTANRSDSVIDNYVPEIPAAKLYITSRDAWIE